MSFSIARRHFLGSAIGVGSAIAATSCVADPPPNQKPVYRVGKNTTTPAQPSNKADHPLDKALEIAEGGLETIQRDVRDYECTLIKQERVGGVLGDQEFMKAKIRNRVVEDGKIIQPLSVYLKFLKPAAVQGREVLWVEGKNSNKLLAHEGGRLGNWTPAVWLKPDGPIAMRGNLYPITDIGIENLVVKLIEKGERDRARPAEECRVEFNTRAKINERPCTMVKVIHPEKRDYYDFHIAEIFIDNELNVPVRYQAFTWPATAAGKPQLLESYTYFNIKLNVGLDDSDFNERNKEYKFH